MSSAVKKTSHCHDKSNRSRPATVRKKLNFDQSCSNLQICYSKSAKKTSNKNVAIKKTREVFVSEWLKKHEDDFFGTENIVYPLSPILSSSLTKRSPNSPIVENSSKRPRQHDSNEGNNSCQLDVCLKKQHESHLLSPSRSQQNKFQMQEKSPDLFSSESPSTSFKKSPILGGKILARKLERRRNLLRQNKTNETSRTCNNSKIQNEPIPNISTMTIPDVKSNLSQIEEETFFEVEQVENEELTIKIETREDEEEILEGNLNDSLIIDSSEDTIPDSKLNEIERENEIKDYEIEEHDSTFIDEGSESEKSECFIIEDADTPGIFANCVNEKPTDENLPPIKSSMDSQDTFFSKAESEQSQAIQLSQKISQISSTRFNRPNSSDVINIISNETSSPKPILESFCNILRSEKKKRRVKK